MLGINLKHSLAIVVVAAGVLTAAGSASAGTHQSGAILYNGHAGLGASVYQHNQTDLDFFASSPRALAAGVTDGASNTIMFGERTVVESVGTKYTMFLALQVDAGKDEVSMETLESRAVFRM